MNAVFQLDSSAAPSLTRVPTTTSRRTATSFHTTTRPSTSSVESGMAGRSFRDVVSFHVHVELSGTKPMASAAIPSTLEPVNVFLH